MQTISEYRICGTIGAEHWKILLEAIETAEMEWEAEADHLLGVNNDLRLERMANALQLRLARRHLLGIASQVSRLS